MIPFEYAHRLLYYTGKCNDLHGHSGKAFVTLSSPDLNQDGFVMDFGDIKRSLRKWINENWDHQYLAHQDDPLLSEMKEIGLPYYTFEQNPTAEIIAAELFGVVEDLISPPVKCKSVWIQETETGRACYEPE